MVLLGPLGAASMITRLQLKNFRSHAFSEISLEPINLLVGPTGAGKSNVFKALAMLQNLIHHELAELFPPGLGEFQWVRSRWAGETDPISFEVDLTEVEGHAGTAFRYHLSIADSPAGLYVLAEKLQQKSGEDDWQWVFQRRGGAKRMGEFGEVSAYEPSLLYKTLRDQVATPDAPNVQAAKAVARALSSVGYYHLEVSELKSLGSGQSTDRIDYYGGRLPDVLACLKSTPEYAPAYQAIFEGLRELLPDVETILVTQVGPGRQGIALSFKGHHGSISARDVSDGTALTLGLLSILHGPKRPALLCLEEPETGLHPRRLRWLFDRMVNLAYPDEGQRRTQIILTTHSPDLVNLFGEMPEAVKVVDWRAEPSGVRASRVTRLPEILAKLQGPGEVAESIGHAWATGLYESL
ncbi:MAG: ATP-binding protein [Polyangiaceae bacterium]|jgi:predicted ATPase|nr:ATP-binding protein [Polyangiaceae bacterium]